MSQGLEVRLQPDVSVEDMRVGKFLVVRGVRSHAVPMPVVVRTRPYDETFYAEVGEIPWEEMSAASVLKAGEAAKADLGL